jgi:hypothetical protein
VGCNIVYDVISVGGITAMQRMKLVFSVSVALACSTSELPEVESPKAAPTQRTVHPPTARKATLAELEKRAWAAVALDGHPDGKRIVNSILFCKPIMENCKKLAEQQMAKSRTAVFVARALSGDDVEQNLVRAEQAAAEDGPKRRAAATKKKEDDDAVKAMSTLCEKQRQPCADRCLKDELPACVAEGLISWRKDGNFDDARQVFARACNGGFQPGCDQGKAVDAAEKEALAKIDDAWERVEALANQLAVKKYALEAVVAKRGPEPYQRMAAHIANFFEHSFCPNVKAFLAVSTKAAFTKRSKAHCEERPPGAPGPSNDEVILKAQCKQVYAKSCP